MAKVKSNRINSNLLDIIVKASATMHHGKLSVAHSNTHSCMVYVIGEVNLLVSLFLSVGLNDYLQFTSNNIDHSDVNGCAC